MMRMEMKRKIIIIDENMIKINILISKYKRELRKKRVNNQQYSEFVANNKS